MTAPTPVKIRPEPVDDVDLDDWFSTSDDNLHVACCAKEAFLCGHPFHPEAVAPTPSTDPACDDCLDEIVEGRCPDHRPTHFHCPLVERESGLLTFCKGPGR